MPTRLETYQTQAFNALRKLEAQYEKQVAEALLSALDEIRVQMSKLYERYAGSDGKLTKAEMTRYNRLATAEKELVATMNTATRANLATINRLRPEQYQAAFFYQAWAIDNASGLRLAWGQLNRDAILQNLASELYHISTERYGQDARLAIRAALNTGLAQGQGYREMMRDLKTAINTTNARALRILRTEGQTAVNAGTEAAYTRAIDKGVQGSVVWSATLDGRTRDDHAAMDQQVQDENGLFRLPDGETAPYPGWEGLSAAERINCRCTTRFQIDGYEPALRRSRDEGLVPYQSYAEWSTNQRMF